jgi:plasmid maintenance system antidote protein VapI
MWPIVLGNDPQATARDEKDAPRFSRLARVFGTTADFWMNLQAQHDLSAAAIKSRRALKAIKPLAA